MCKGREHHEDIAGATRIMKQDICSRKKSCLGQLHQVCDFWERIAALCSWGKVYGSSRSISIVLGRHDDRPRTPASRGQILSPTRLMLLPITRILHPSA